MDSASRSRSTSATPGRGSTAYEAQVRAAQQPGSRLAVRVEGRTAVVAGTRTVRLPFRLPGTQPVQVSAVARARAPVLP